jgi:hypothetical protein
MMTSKSLNMFTNCFGKFYFTFLLILRGCYVRNHMVVGLTNNYLDNQCLSPMRRGFALGFVNYKKRCTRLAAACDNVYQLLVHGRWFSPGTAASSTTRPSSLSHPGPFNYRYHDEIRYIYERKH